MEDKTGWICLHRDITDMKGYFGHPFSRTECWIDLLLLAEWRDSREFYIRGNLVTVRRGQVAMSTRELAKRWRLARKTVIERLSELVTDERIKIIPQKGNLINIISIVNYQKYQDGSPQSSPQSSPLSITNKQDNNHDGGARAREGKPPGSSSRCLTDDELLALWFPPGRANKDAEAMCMQWGITVGVLRTVAEEVLRDWRLTGKTHTDRSDQRRHFLTLIRKKLNQRKQDEISQRQHPNELSRKEREAAFMQHIREHVAAGKKR